VYDAVPSDERSIQIKFNILCNQFENNQKYIPAAENQKIPDNENISYEILVNKKRYECCFYQKPKEELSSICKNVCPLFLNKYTEEQLNNPTEEIMSEITDFIFKEYYSKKSVWFMISYHSGSYRIVIYYDNEYNNANGEDL